MKALPLHNKLRYDHASDSFQLLTTVANLSGPKKVLAKFTISSSFLSPSFSSVSALFVEAISSTFWAFSLVHNSISLLRLSRLLCADRRLRMRRRRRRLSSSLPSGKSAYISPCCETWLLESAAGEHGVVLLERLLGTRGKGAVRETLLPSRLRFFPRATSDAVGVTMLFEPNKSWLLVLGVSGLHETLALILGSFNLMEEGTSPLLSSGASTEKPGFLLISWIKFDATLILPLVDLPSLTIALALAFSSSACTSTSGFSAADDKATYIPSHKPSTNVLASKLSV
mmetsp:Transcript_18528/g.29074  ORF Transcript_18528/g.29074 Transcript_18528/m.29074 type:complete len:285 (-) Transcript_18528:132-986(-)